ncbi:hypothetical protein HYS92_01915 [Candidatus Daviesbacteria bacterium]|nr:hypothetical protein [Candidatus Daviesbacteria bacterium]
MANGYVYVMGGNDGVTTVYSSVYYAKLNADGSTGAWKTNSNSLPVARQRQSSVVANGYVYVLGGDDNVAIRSSVYYAKINSDGSTGTWTTNSNSLPLVRYYHSSIIANGYMYAIGGYDTDYRSSVYYAKLNADGSLGAWATNSNSLPAIRGIHSSIVANGYVYVMGGTNDGSASHSTIYYAKLNADGSLGAWATNSNSLPAIRRSHSSIVVLLSTMLPYLRLTLLVI